MCEDSLIVQSHEQPSEVHDDDLIIFLSSDIPSTLTKQNWSFRRSEASEDEDGGSTS